MYTNGIFKENDFFHGKITFQKAFKEADDVDEIFQRKLLRFSAEGRRITKDYLKTPVKGKKHSEADIDCFLDKLHFATNEVDIKELEKNSRRLLQRLCCFSNTEFAYPAFEKEIKDWMTAYRGVYLVGVKIRKFLQSLQDKLGKMEFGFRDPVMNFVGRTEELEQMDKILSNDFKKIFVISGLGGIGKSELARRFIRKNYIVFKRIVWITGDSESSLINAFQSLAESLEIDINDKNINKLVEDIYKLFESQAYIFVFDNVDIIDNFTDKNHYLNFFLPKNNNSPSIIITSRVKCNWEDVTNISLKELDQDDAAFFIKSNIPSSCHSTNDSRNKIAERLQYFPIALQQAVAYIANNSILPNSSAVTYSIEKYLKTFEEEAAQIKSEFQESLKIFSSITQEYANTTMTTCGITFNVIKKKDNIAAKILNLVSHFAPDNINTKNIYLYFDIKEEKVQKSLILLKDYSVIEFNDKIHIPRLFQKVILLKLKEKKEDDTTLRLVLNLYRKIDLEQKISVWGKLVGYRYIQQEYTRLPNHIMQSSIDSSRYQQAYTYGRKSVNVLYNICTKTDPNLLMAMGIFAWLSFKNRHVQEALTVNEDILRRAIEEVCKCNTKSQTTENERNENNSHHRNEDSNKCTTKYGMQNCYLQSGNFTDALEMFSVVFKNDKFKIEKEILKKNIAFALNAINWIVLCYSQLGDKKETLTLYKQVHQVQKYTEADKIFKKAKGK